MILAVHCHPLHMELVTRHLRMVTEEPTGVGQAPKEASFGQNVPSLPGLSLRDGHQAAYTCATVTMMVTHHACASLQPFAGGIILGRCRCLLQQAAHPTLFANACHEKASLQLTRLSVALAEANHHSLAEATAGNPLGIAPSAGHHNCGLRITALHGHVWVLAPL